MFFGVFDFFQKTNENKSTWGIIVVKANLFVRFLEELSAWKNHDDFVWPLVYIMWNVFWCPLQDFHQKYWGNSWFTRFIHICRLKSCQKGVILKLYLLNKAVAKCVLYCKCVFKYREGVDKAVTVLKLNIFSVLLSQKLYNYYNRLQAIA